MRVERVAKRRVRARRVARPQLAVVRVRRRRCLSVRGRQRCRRMSRRRQHDRRIRGEDVGNAHLLRHRTGRDLEGGGRHDDVAALGSRGDHLELRGHRRVDDVTQLFGGRRRRPGQRGRWPRFGEGAHRRTDWHHVEAVALDPLAEVGRHAEPGLMAGRLQLQRERHERRHVAARSDRGQQDAHPLSGAREASAGPAAPRRARAGSSGCSRRRCTRSARRRPGTPAAASPSTAACRPSGHRR